MIQWSMSCSIGNAYGMPYAWLASCLIPESSCCLCSDDGISPAAILSSPFKWQDGGDEQDNNMTWILHPLLAPAQTQSILRTDHLHVFSFLNLYGKHWLDSRFNFKAFTAHISHYKIFDYKYQSARFFPRRSSPKCQIQIQNKRTQLMCYVSL